MRLITVLAAAAALAFAPIWTAEAQTLKAVQDRGKLVCGVSQGIAGFSIKDDKGEWSGFDVDFCRALAAAIFNDPGKVEYVPLSAAERFDALKDKKIDVLSRNSTWTMGREEDAGLLFAGVTYYDGQAFMVPKSRNATSALLPDAGRRLPATRAIATGQPPALPSRAPAHALLAAARRARVPTALSRDAGRYLCNYLFWRGIEAGRAKTGPAQVAFIHVPKIDRARGRPGKRRRLTLDDLTRAGAEILRTLALTAGGK